MQTSKEIVKNCVKFETPERMPRDLWVLPWAETHFAEQVAEMKQRFPTDFSGTAAVYLPSPREKGDPYAKGEYVDDWGCKFVNFQEGVIGEVKEPMIRDISDWKIVQPPYETLPRNKQQAYDEISRFYEKSEKFVMANLCPRPWERYQFLRGTEEAMVDMMMPEEGGADLLKAIHDFYLKEMEFWVRSDVDAVMFMDDWGSQNQLLIPPRIWRELFKPLYKEYCDMAHAEGKFVFMHSDGYIQEIFTDLVEIGVDAINSQLFTMDFEYLRDNVKGKITFWGEIDRQHVLPSENPQQGRDAVRKVAEYLYDPTGGIVAQLEFGAGANPETVLAVFEEWEKIDQENRR
ncbi:MAG: methyltransferase [Calditrichaeota bacterium]|nr:methyltransferase [Calditrichota bacterium]